MDTSETDAADWYSEDAATFGDRVVAAREALGMTQTELAKRLGVKLETVRGWEDDVSEPRSNKLQMLAGVLNVSIMWLLNGHGDGLDGPGEEAVIPGDVRGILGEIRAVRADMARLANRLGVLEKRLRHALKEHG
ncbi:helix-turn-helix domain-containing protein [Rhodovulum sp. BSW8]|uniref:Helix-turn-helix domain-containing protein n=1 Tax=Rhodovulum visakhapatnamense TaxID=364297 RepID=A0A4R8G579_9RHOB|nr:MULTISPECIES: helix-turn-helix domain-containing protein [Rhodovulum]OLS45248.1 transcriptional regulator [Rhodovulum sulfidophilum]MBL3569606.1 helix-turn-helix domain-containing protein [Rhodovulum visakhapatnamense]MBL3578459.1 helix-turn-helix domain-containing protein [Rhodovulum visakhapatnamense]RBO54805.1 helix-turn-helix domain-containing protein [Rhodovulum sp. BSW8]TDX33603.1 helix-turn-helix protein [Rhodovulum visakhapatnamense]